MNEHRKIEQLTAASYRTQIAKLDRDILIAIGQNEQAQLDLLQGTIDKHAATAFTDEVKNLQARKASLEAAWRAAQRQTETKAKHSDKEARHAAYQSELLLLEEREKRLREWHDGVKDTARRRAALLEVDSAIIALANPFRSAFAENSAQASSFFGEFVRTVRDLTFESAVIREEAQAGLIGGTHFKTIDIDTVAETRNRDILRHLDRLIERDD